MRLSVADAALLQERSGIDLGVKTAADGCRLPASSEHQRAGKRARKGRDPEAELWLLMQARWGEEVTREYKKAVPGRRFSLDMAFVRAKLGVEVDGWEFHGKHKSDFHRDREKRNLLAVNGWAVLAFSARDVFKDPSGILDMIDAVYRSRRPD